MPVKHCNSLKMDQNKGLIYEIKNNVNNNKIPSKFQSNKKENKPISLLNNDNNNKKLTFTYLAFKNEEKKLNLIDFDNSFENEKKSEKSFSNDNDKNNEENIKNKNDQNSSKSSSLDNEKDENKLVIKSKFKINDTNILKEINDEKDEQRKNLYKNDLKQKKDNNENHKNLIKSRKKGYRFSMQQNEIPLLNKNIIISSVITKAGICDEEEKINQDSYLIRENIFNEDINLYGIFDGHGDNGHLISKYISKYINDYYLNSKNIIDNKDDLSKLQKNNIKKLFLEKKRKNY